MANVKYYPEDVLVEKSRAENTAGLTTSTTTHLNAKRNTLPSAKRRISLSMRSRQRNLSIGRASRLKLANNHKVQKQ